MGKISFFKEVFKQHVIHFFLTKVARPKHCFGLATTIILNKLNNTTK